MVSRTFFLSLGNLNPAELKHETRIGNNWVCDRNLSNISRYVHLIFASSSGSSMFLFSLYFILFSVSIFVLITLSFDLSDIGHTKSQRWRHGFLYGIHDMVQIMNLRTWLSLVARMQNMNWNLLVCGGNLSYNIRSYVDLIFDLSSGSSRMIFLCIHVSIFVLVYFLLWYIRYYAYKEPEVTAMFLIKEICNLVLCYGVAFWNSLAMLVWLDIGSLWQLSKLKSLRSLVWSALVPCTVYHCQLCCFFSNP